MESNAWVMWNMGTFNDPWKSQAESAWNFQPKMKGWATTSQKNPKQGYSMAYTAYTPPINKPLIYDISHNLCHS